MKKFITVEVVLIIAIVCIPFLLSRSCEVTKEDKTYEDITVNVYMHKQGKTVKMNLEDYLAGVVAAEMPAGFEQQALNAQAVAARTYTLARITGEFEPDDRYHKGADICTDFTHCQAWVSKREMLEQWGGLSGEKYWNKITTAIKDTKREIIIYKGKIVNPVYHSNGGGKTESAKDIWDEEVPYLISVSSKGDVYSPFYNDKASFTVEQIKYLFSKQEGYEDFDISGYDIDDIFEVKERTSGGGVKSIRVGDYEFSGVDVREILSLSSIKFDILIDNNKSIIFKTKGSGHGVGMSQWGANYLAVNGGTYKEILKHYYPGIIIEIYR